MAKNTNWSKAGQIGSPSTRYCEPRDSTLSLTSGQAGQVWSYTLPSRRGWGYPTPLPFRQFRDRGSSQRQPSWASTSLFQAPGAGTHRAQACGLPRPPGEVPAESAFASPPSPGIMVRLHWLNPLLTFLRAQSMSTNPFEGAREHSSSCPSERGMIVRNPPLLSNSLRLTCPRGTQK